MAAPLKSMEVREWEETNSWSDEIRFLIMCLSSVSSHLASFLFLLAEPRSSGRAIVAIWSVSWISPASPAPVVTLNAQMGRNQ